MISPTFHSLICMFTKKKKKKRSRVYLLLTQAIMKETVDPVTHQMYSSRRGTPGFIYITWNLWRDNLWGQNNCSKNSLSSVTVLLCFNQTSPVEILTKKTLGPMSRTFKTTLSLYLFPPLVHYNAGVGELEMDMFNREFCCVFCWNLEKWGYQLSI